MRAAKAPAAGAGTGPAGPAPRRGSSPAGDGNKYRMTISRMTLDRLGIELFDRVSAVLAELAANAYDADARQVEMTLPWGRLLATSAGDRSLEIRVRDDGHGMTPEEVNAFYLRVGLNRRRRGERTPGGRLVLGRKGIGKLAPFGICRRVEIITAGGPRTRRGYQVSHLYLQYDGIVSENEREYHPEPGERDGTWVPASGTEIVLRDFRVKRVPNGDELHRQLSAKFGIARPDWRVELADMHDPSNRLTLGDLPLDTLPGARIDLAARPVPVPGGPPLPVRGWVAYAKNPYGAEFSGVRVYARGRLVAQTRDFDLPAGFAGEFKLRSYVVGEVHADWLDDREDLIRADRQDILWNSDRGDALRRWGQEILRELAGLAEEAVQARTWEEFTERTHLERRLLDLAPGDRSLRDAVRSAARALVRTTDRDKVRDRRYTDRLLRLAMAIGPHQQLLLALHEASSSGGDTLAAVIELFSRARVAEMYALGQVADERVQVLARLRELVHRDSTSELELQRLVEDAPWLLAPEWTPLNMNQSLARVRRSFQDWYRVRHGEELVTSAIASPTRRPDFVLLNTGGWLEIVEIKRPGHGLTDAELERALRYLSALTRFIEDNEAVAREFPACRLTVVCDRVALTSELAASALANNQRVQRRTWLDVITSTERVHEQFRALVEQTRSSVLDRTEALSSPDPAVPDAGGGPPVEPARGPDGGPRPGASRRTEGRRGQRRRPA